MHLITMAHLGEAQALIDEFELKKTSPHIFENDQLILLLTGEGPFEAASSTAHLLGQKKIERIINLGVAGSLNENIQLGEIYPLRSIYLVIDGKPQFKSFKSNDKGIDALTSFERILKPEKALALTGVAEIVDREAWGVAFSAKNFSVPFESAKLISDYAGQIGACELVREEAYSSSLKLSQYLKNKLEIRPEEIFSEIKLPDFHFTFSMSHQFDDLLEKISLREDLTKDEILKTLPLEDLRMLKLRPKERGARLIEILEMKLDPLKERLQFGLKNWKAPIEKNGFLIQTDPTWEKASVKISFEVESQEELKRKTEHLASLDLGPFYELRNGSFHVE
jgi:Phosphorylase superfamily